MWIAAAWLVLALVHLPPALAAVSPRLRQRMYGVEERADISVILIHRGVLFAAVTAACIYASFNAEARPLAALVASISLLGFLLTYALARFPARLRSIALIDTLAPAPLALVVIDVA